MSSRFSVNSETFVSELTENIEESVLRNYLRIIDIACSNIQLHNSVFPVVRGLSHKETRFYF